MYEFHCDLLKNKYGNNSRLLFTDTDSLIYEIKPEDVYEDFSSEKKKCLIVAIIPLSQNTMIIQTNCNSNKLVIGKMKDETAGVAIK